MPWDWHTLLWRPAMCGGLSISSARHWAGSRSRDPAISHRAAAWLAIAPEVELHLIEEPEFQPSRFEQEFGRHIAVTFTRAEFPELKERLRGRGKPDRPVRETPFERFFFRDPNGYVFEVVEEQHDEPRPLENECAISFAADAQRIGDAIDVVEPGRDQCDLQDGAIVEADAAQPLVVQGRDLGRVLGELDHVVDHHPFLIRDRRLPVIFSQRLDERIIQGDPTQKLCVRDNSVMALVGERHHRGDHLVLSAIQRQIGRHQGAERGKRVIAAPAESACARRRCRAGPGQAPALAARTRGIKGVADRPLPSSKRSSASSRGTVRIQAMVVTSFHFQEFMSIVGTGEDQPVVEARASRCRQPTGRLSRRRR